MKPGWLALAAVFLVAVPGRTAAAQPGPAIRHLSAKPRLQENGTLYDVEVRLTTTVPAHARLHYGTDQRCEQTADFDPEPRRNHRFDMVDCPIDQKRWVRVAVSAEGQPEVVGEVTEINPPRPFPVGSAKRLSVGLSVTETEGVARSEPVTFGIPLPEGALGRSEMVRLADGPTPIPITTRVLARWPDRTIKWLLVTGRLDVDEKSTRQVAIEIGSEVQPSTVRGRTMIRRQGDAFVVDTGASRVTIDKRTGRGAFHLGERLVSKLPVGERLFQHFDDQYLLGEQKGRRAAGQARQGVLVVAVRDFWPQWPKSLAAEQAARHNADVDVVHYAAGQRAGPGRKREVGQAWVHCMGHTGGYYAYDYRGLTIELGP